MQWFKGFFEENLTVASAMRLIFIIGSIWAMAFVSYCVIAKLCTFIDGMQYFVVIFALLSGGKVGSKYLEGKIPPNILSPEIQQGQ